MIRHLFIEHPRSVGEGYFEHMRASATVGGRLLAAAGGCFVHALVPGWCTTTGSSAILKLHGEIYPRRFEQPTL